MPSVFSDARRYRLAFVTPAYFSEDGVIGGGERYVHNMAASLARESAQRYTVDIISFGEYDHTLPLASGVTLHILARDYSDSSPFNSVAWLLAHRLRTVDLVHIHQPFTRSGELGILLASYFQKPLIVTDHGGHFSTGALSLRLLDLADCVLTYSDYARSLVLSTSDIVTIKGGVDAEFFIPAPDARDRTHALFVGRLLPHKGVDRLLLALPRDLPLVICGQPYDERYFHLLRALASEKRVEFVTNADDRELRELYRSAFVTVLPSVYTDWYGNTVIHPELMGLTVLESMSCATPVLVSDVGALPEFVRHGQTGFVYKDLDDLRLGLNRFREDAALVSQMGLAARADVDANLSAAIAARRLIEVYTDTIARRQ